MSDPEYLRKWREANPDYMRKWRAAKKEHVAAYEKEYKQTDKYRESKRRSDKKHYETVVKQDPEKLARARAVAAKWGSENRERRTAVELRRRHESPGVQEKLAGKAKQAYWDKSPEERKALIASRAEYHRQYRIANAEKLRELSREYLIATKEQRRATWKIHYAKNRLDYIRRAEQRVRQLSERGTYTQADINAIFEKQSGVCVGCDGSLLETFEVDHIMPVARDGANLPYNLQLLCLSCNRRKRSTHPAVWFARIGKPEEWQKIAHQYQNQQERSQMITEGQGPHGIGALVKFKLDGVVKSINGPVTGAALHALAGNPVELVHANGGKPIHKNDDVIDFGKEDVELVTKHSLGDSDKLNPEHVMAANETVVNPPHGQAMSHVSKQEADDIKKAQNEAKKAEEDAAHEAEKKPAKGAGPNAPVVTSALGAPPAPVTPTVSTPPVVSKTPTK